MPNLSLSRPAAIGLALVLAAFSGQAADQAHPCASVADAASRLACYDSAFPPIVGADTLVDAETRRQQAEEEFGLNPKQLFERKPQHLREAEPDRIEGVVEGVIVRASGERVVSLENGQIWVLTEVTSRGRLKAGDQVTIRQAALGSFMLVTSKGVALRAKRLQ